MLKPITDEKHFILTHATALLDMSSHTKWRISNKTEAQSHALARFLTRQGKKNEEEI